jgi:hypothetical protein
MMPTNSVEVKRQEAHRGPAFTFLSIIHLVCVKFQGESILGLTKFSRHSRAPDAAIFTLAGGSNRS